MADNEKNKSQPLFAESVGKPHKNLRGRSNVLKYYRTVSHTEKKTASRRRNGELQTYTMKSQKKSTRVYLTDEEVMQVLFVLEGNGAVLKTGGNHTVIDNYFILFWTPVLGLGPRMLYETLRLFSYQKGYAWPSMAFLEKTLDTTRPTLLKWIKTLETYGFIWCLHVEDESRDNKNSSNLFIVRKSTPLLSQKLIDQLDPMIQKRHQEFIQDLKQSSVVVAADDVDYAASLHAIIEQKLIEQRSRHEENGTPADLFAGVHEAAATAGVEQSDTGAENIAPPPPPNPSDALSLAWCEYIELMRNTLAQQTFEAWFADTTLERQDGDTLVVRNQASFTAKQVCERFSEPLREVLRQHGISYRSIVPCGPGV